MEQSDCQMMQVNVQMLSGPLPPMDVPEDATVRDLKQRVQSIDSNFKVHLQKFLIRDRQHGELLNGRTLKSYGISSDTIIVLVIAEQLFKHTSEFQYTVNYTMNFNRFDKECITKILVSTDDLCYGAENLMHFASKYRSVRSFEIDGFWHAAHLLFCQLLIKVRADIDIEYVFRKFDSLVIEILEFCKTAQNPKLKFIGCYLSSETDCTSLSKALQSIPSVKELTLKCNGISDSGFIALAPACKSMSSLQILNLEQNNIGDADGCVALAAALSSMSALVSVNLSANTLKGTGCAILVTALAQISTLQDLCLSRNEIGNVGCKVLAPALESMTSLRDLELGYNQITDKGFADLESALVLLSHASLDRLGLGGNRIVDAARCRQVLQSIPHLVV